MKTSEIVEQLASTPDVEEVDEDDVLEILSYTDDDFWEALDFLETAKKHIDRILRYNDSFPKIQRAHLKNLSVDVGRFLDEFIVNPEVQS